MKHPCACISLWGDMQGEKRRSFHANLAVMTLPTCTGDRAHDTIFWHLKPDDIVSRERRWSVVVIKLDKHR